MDSARASTGVKSRMTSVAAALLHSLQFLRPRLLIIIAVALPGEIIIPQNSKRNQRRRGPDSKEGGVHFQLLVANDRPSCSCARLSRAPKPLRFNSAQIKDQHEGELR